MRKMEKCRHGNCNTVLSQLNPYRICYVHQGRVSRERLPACLREELQRLEVLEQKKQPNNRHHLGLTQKEGKQKIHFLSQFLKDYSDEDLIDILEKPEEIYESLLREDESKAEGFGEVVIFFRDKKEEILQEFLR